jgi:hypothetical protein
MRFCETARLRRSDIDENRIVIDGKTHDIRELPLESWPEFLEIIREVSALWESEYVWPWRKVGPVWTELQVVKSACRIEHSDVHTWRATAEHRWLAEYNINPKDFCAIAGRSRGVCEKQYAPRRKAIEVARAGSIERWLVPGARRGDRALQNLVVHNINRLPGMN